MKYISIIFTCLFTMSALAQDKDITGYYYQSSGNPEGGTSFVVMPNNTFVVMYFGGMRKGSWESKDDTYVFTFHVEPQFVLYARNNPSVKDSVSVRMSLDSNKGLAVRFNETGDAPFIPIFNNDANCFEYPYEYKQAASLTTVEAYLPDPRSYYSGETEEPATVYQFNIATNYNEYIITGLSSEYSRPGSFVATYDGNTLSIEGEKPVVKKGTFEDMNIEDVAYIKQMTENELLPKTLEYGNEFFPYYENPSTTDLISFERIEPMPKKVNGIKISEKSIFIATCED